MWQLVHCIMQTTRQFKKKIRNEMTKIGVRKEMTKIIEKSKTGANVKDDQGMTLSTGVVTEATNYIVEYHPRTSAAKTSHRSVGVFRLSAIKHRFLYMRWK